MRCTYCCSQIGKIKEVYVAFCKTSKNHFGLILNAPNGETVAWVSETRMHCKKCRPSAEYVMKNWTLTTR